MRCGGEGGGASQVTPGQRRWRVGCLEDPVSQVIPVPVLRCRVWRGPGHKDLTSYRKY